MTLSKWRKAQKLSRAALAEQLGLGNQNVVYRYEMGTRVPRPEIMRRITKLTEGKVTPNDFFRE